MPRRPDLPCSQCGTLLWRGSTSAAVPMCRSCRSSHRPTNAAGNRYTHACGDCGKPCWAPRCKSCDSDARRQGADPRHLKAKKRRAYAARVAREVGSPGLNPSQRRRLLERWKRQAKPCAYCDEPATSIDHVIPLARGGTHFEGNLAPCCSACNSSKSAFTVAEWRHRRRTHPRYVTPPTIERTPRAAPDYTKRVCKVYFVTCECGTTFCARGSGSRNCPDCRYSPTPLEQRVSACKTCGVMTPYTTKPRTYCSQECRTANASRREERRRYRRTAAGREARRRQKANARARRRRAATATQGTLF